MASDPTRDPRKEWSALARQRRGERRYTEADLAARVEAERVAIRRVIAEIGTEDDRYSTPTMDRLEARGRKNAVREISEAIRALGPTPAYDAAIQAARAEGMEAAAVIAEGRSIKIASTAGVIIAAAIRAAKDQPA